MHERFRDSLNDIILNPVVKLTRDLPGYRIGAHTGIFKKVIAAEFDLPEDNSKEPLETTFYRRHGDGSSNLPCACLSCRAVVTPLP